VTAYQRIRRPPLLLPISPRIYPSSCCAQSRTSIFSSPFYHPLCGYLLPAGLPNCCLLPTACCLLAAAVGWFRLCRLRVRALRPQIEHSCSCPRARPLGREGPVVLSRVVLTLDGGLCVALCFAIAACSLLRSAMPCFLPSPPAALLYLCWRASSLCACSSSTRPCSSYFCP
jgi:hypothetical protein